MKKQYFGFRSSMKTGISNELMPVFILDLKPKYCFSIVTKR